MLETDAERILPEQTKAAIALLKKGMFSKGFFLMIIRAIIYAIIFSFALGKWTVRVDIMETNLMEKMNTVIENQKSDRAELRDVKSDVHDTKDRVLSLEYYTGFKKGK